MNRCATVFILTLTIGSIFVATSPPLSRPASDSGAVSMEAASWDILYSPSMPAHPTPFDRGWYFDFPNCTGRNACSVNYVTTPAISLSPSSVVKAVFQVATTGSPVFHYKLSANNTCDSPAHVRFILQRKGDDLTAKSEFHRWFSPTGSKLEESSAELTVPLTPDRWTSVFGKRGDLNEQTLTGFQLTLQNLARVGFVFGGGCFFGHGVNVSGGSARFLAVEYSVK